MVINEESRALKDESTASLSKGVTVTETVNPEEASSEKRAGIFVRISPTAKEVLENAASSSKKTYAKVIERLLEYFGLQDSDLQDKILRGIYVNPLKDAENLVARLHRAQHAFENKRYYYAVKTYKVIADKLHGLDSSEELLEVCNYRLGHCWIRLSYTLREEALAALSSDAQMEDRKAKCAELYVVALDALDEALRYLKKVKVDGDALTKLISHYNIACCHSLKAQYMVESSLDHELTLSADLRKATRDPKDSLAPEKAWKAIGEHWRGKEVEENRPDAEAEDALKELEKIYSTPDRASDDSESVKGSSLTSERIWLVEMANDDADLIFLRSDRKLWKPRFDQWKTTALQGDNSIVKAIKDLLKD
jgi:hypothetical protein